MQEQRNLMGLEIMGYNEAKTKKEKIQKLKLHVEMLKDGIEKTKCTVKDIKNRIIKLKKTN